MQEIIEWARWDNLTPETLGTVLLIWEFFRLGFEFYLCYRQRKVYDHHREVPQVLNGWISDDTLENARLYRTDRINLKMFAYVYNAGLTIAYMIFGIMFRLWGWSGLFFDSVGLMIWPSSWDREIGQTICFIILGISFFNLVEIPLHLYFVFRIEERYGFNNQTLRYFLKDYALAIAVQFSIGAPIAASIVKIVQEGGQYFYVYLWIMAIFFMVFSMFVYPTFIAPLFNKFRPLREGRLRRRLTQLATICDFPLKDILVIQESRRSNHPGAYFFGLWNHKMIVIYDNLLIGQPEEDYFSDDSEDEGGLRSKRSSGSNRMYSEEEIEAIVCHEIGHWKKNHIIEELFLVFVEMNLLILVFALVYQNSVLFEAFKFPKNSRKPIFIGLHIVFNYVLDIWNFVVETVFKYRTRCYEYDADKFAVGLNYGEPLKTARIKMHRDNLNWRRSMKRSAKCNKYPSYFVQIHGPFHCFVPIETPTYFE